MKGQILQALLLVTAISLLNFAQANTSQFNTGPVIKGYGKHTSVEQTTPLNGSEKFKVVFDVATQTGEGKLNRKFDSLARFINMHVANGIKLENLKLALVVHGKAGFDLLNNQAYQTHFKQDNPNKALVALLQKENTQVFICGQSAAYYQIANKDLLPGVQVSLSAMTVNAQLQQQGYTLNPF